MVAKPSLEGKMGLLGNALRKYLKQPPRLARKRSDTFCSPCLIDKPITNSIRKHGHGRNNR